MVIVTLLSCFATHSIALPLSPPFPANELQYILDQSQAAMLLSSKMCEGKAEEVLAEQLEKPPIHVKLEKIMNGGHAKVTLEGPDAGEGGMMLYTSGTTARPVCPPFLARQLKWIENTVDFEYRKAFSCRNQC